MARVLVLKTLIGGRRVESVGSVCLSICSNASCDCAAHAKHVNQLAQHHWDSGELRFSAAGCYFRRFRALEVCQIPLGHWSFLRLLFLGGVAILLPNASLSTVLRQHHSSRCQPNQVNHPAGSFTECCGGNCSFVYNLDLSRVICTRP